MWRVVICMLILMLMSGRAALAGDVVKANGEELRDQVKVVGIKDGELVVRVGSKQRTLEWAKVEWINIEGQQQFNDAENARKEGKGTGAGYRAAIRNTRSPTVKILAGLRASEMLEVEGDFAAAASSFIEAYRMGGGGELWKLRPTKVPEDKAKIKAIADAVSREGKLLSGATEQEKVLGWELELRTKAGDAKVADVKEQIAKLKAAEQVEDWKGMEESRSVVYILDHSGSMLDTFDFLRQDMIVAVKGMPREQKFSAIMVSEEAAVIYPELKEASDETKKDFATRLSNFRAQGMNDDLLAPYQEAFEKAFAMKPEAIVFLTDGHMDPRLAEVVAKLNKGKAVKIYTIAWMSDDADYKKQLKDLALANGGKYKFVAEKDLGK